mmetsp:Transcript_60118/g.155364  ORF Transcript_60118/g.155364 Transcript_60118/m.155364 type:complete len:207 (-) Transcript_60118:355-975(-)
MSRRTVASTVCNSRVSQLCIFPPKAFNSLVWKFLAHQSAASALRRPWNIEKADAGESRKDSGNLSARRAILGMSGNMTVRSILAPFLTRLAPPARALIANSVLVCGVSTSWNCFVLLSFIKYLPIWVPIWTKYTSLRGSHNISSLERTHPSPGGMSFSTLVPVFACGSLRRPSKLDSAAPVISALLQVFLSNRSATLRNPGSPSNS